MKTIFVLLVGFMGTVMLGSLLEVRAGSQPVAGAQLGPSPRQCPTAGTMDVGLRLVLSITPRKDIRLCPLDIRAKLSRLEGKGAGICWQTLRRTTAGEMEATCS